MAGLISTLQTAPGQPQNLKLSSTELVTYEPPISDGGALITSYAITVLKDGVPVDTFTAVEPGLLSKQLTGLTPGQTYTVSVVAINAAGLSSATPATLDYTVPQALVRFAVAPCDCSMQA